MSEILALPLPQAQIAFGVFTIIGTIVAMLQITEIWRRQKDPIIRNRGFASLIIIDIGCVLCFLVLGIAGTFNLQCWFYPLALGLLMFMFLFSFERILVLYILYLVTLKSREYAKNNLGFDDLQLETAQTGFYKRAQDYLFLNRSKINTTDFFCKFKLYEYWSATFTGAMIFGLFALLGPQSLSKPFLSDECISTGQETWKWFLVINASMMPGTVFLPMQLKKVKENYFALKEFAAFAKFAVVTVVIVPIHAFWPKNIFPPRNAYYFWMMMIMQISIYITNGYVLTLIKRSRNGDSYHSSLVTSLNLQAQNSTGKGPSSLASAKTPGEKLLFVLTDPDAFHALELFLCKEFSVENGYFYNSVEKYKMRCNENRPNFNARTEATKIYNEYCSETASLCINISHTHRQRIVKFFNDEKNLDEATFIHESRQIFTDAQTEVFDLILRDSFRRFINSQEYKAYKGRTGAGDEETKPESNRLDYPSV